MTPQLAALKELALKATRGPWLVYQSEQFEKYGNTIFHEYYLDTGDQAVKEVALHVGQADSAYIAATNPDVILSLIEKLEVATKALEFYADLDESYAIDNKIYDPLGFKAQEALKELEK